MVARRGPRAWPGATALGLVTFVLAALPAGTDAAFPGGNGRIVFTAAEGGFNQFISDIRPGERPRRLTRPRRACRKRDSFSWTDGGPQYSPDGNWIVYSHEDNCRSGYPYDQQIRIMRADGSANRALLRRRFGDKGGALGASFSPDGQRLLVSISNGDRQRRMIISPFTGRVLASRPFPRPTHAVWGPDGRIATAMELSPPRYRRGLFVGTLDRPLRRFRQLTRPLRHPMLSSYDGDADWHPKASRLVFERELDCRNEDRCPIGEGELTEHTDIYTVATDGKPRLRKLTRGGRFADPAFSPDGRRIVAQRWPDLVVGSAQGRRWRVLARNGASGPDWQPVTAVTATYEHRN